MMSLENKKPRAPFGAGVNLNPNHGLQWCRRKDLNPGHPDYKSGALPTELQRRNGWDSMT
jgi:hypothetical protein